MQYIFLLIITIPFLFINTKIILSDIKNKKIPNKYLLLLISLIPFYYFYTVYFFDINYFNFIFQIIITIIISFFLYSIGIWSAGDAKYLLTLGLFIPNIGIFTFIINIAIITFTYLFLYFIWFYIGKPITNLNYSKNLYKNIFYDLKNRLIFFLEGNINNKKSILKIFLWLVKFLIIFVTIAIIRITLLNEIVENNKFSENFYHILTGFIVTFLIAIYLIGIIYIKFRIYISNKYNIEEIKTNLVFLTLILILLLSFIIYKYNINPFEIKSTLYKIFGLIIFLYLIFIVLKYLYKVCFNLSESLYINYKEVKPGDIIDKKYLMDMIRYNGTLKYIYHKNFKIKGRIKKRMISGNIKKYYNNLNNPLELEDCIKIKNLIESRNYLIKKIKKKNDPINKLKIYKTFAFGGYIFAGFIITIIFGNKIFTFLLEFAIKIIESYI